MLGLTATEKDHSCSQTSFRALFTWQLFREPFLCHPMKNCTLHHLIFPVLLPCFIFPLSLITRIQDITIIYLVYCRSPCLLVSHPNLFFLSFWAPGFSARNYTALVSLWPGRTTWLRCPQNYVCNIDVWNFLVIFLKKLALDPSFLLAGWNLQNKCWGRQNCPTGLGP